MILVVAEHFEGSLRRSALETIQAARELKSAAPIAVLILGDNVGRAASEAATLCDQVLVADLPGLARYDAELWSAAVAEIAHKGEASLVLISGSRSGREFSARVAVKLDAPLLEDVISLSEQDGAFEAERYTFLARVTERIRAQASVVVATVKSGAFAVAAPLAERAEEYEVELSLPKSRVEITAQEKARTGRISLTDADVVVAGGRGVGSKEDFASLVEGLANHFGAAVGATRAVVDAGWRPYAEQVGQTGKTVQPKVYWAIGISGAVQHMSGMGKSKVIIAINKDADAPIFKSADYGVVGDVREIVPAILERLRA